MAAVLRLTILLGLGRLESGDTARLPAVNRIRSEKKSAPGVSAAFAIRVLPPVGIVDDPYVEACRKAYWGRWFGSRRCEDDWAGATSLCL